MSAQSKVRSLSRRLCDFDIYLHQLYVTRTRNTKHEEVPAVLFRIPLSLQRFAALLRESTELERQKAHTHAFTMGWISRYGKWQDDLAPPKPEPVRFKHILGGFIFLVLFGSCLACLPLTVIFVPKPQSPEFMPKGIHCATCEEIWKHNRDLFNRDDMFCYGVPVYDRPTTKTEEVMFTKEKRCWAMKKGHDEWMRPLSITDEEMKKWDEEVRTRAFRGRSWPR